MSSLGNLLVDKEKELKPMFYHDRCDKYDYLIAAGCGAIAGLVDIFLVGSPGDSVLGKWTDDQVDNVVKSFAKKMGWNPRSGNENSISSAIGFLRSKYNVNYDQATGKAAGGVLQMNARDHHMKSLGHSPDIIGLFFSILNQFTSTSSFLNKGEMITIKTDTQELQGNNFISKLFCGIANWFGHLMSDVAGDNGSRGNGNRGMGIVLPFYELFNLCEFGKFSDGNGNKQTLSMIATRVYTEGYDARFGLTMAIPVILCDLSIKLIWSLKHYFYHKRPIIECIPTKKHDDLRLMLIIGDGVLCLMDGVDAAVRSGGNWINFFLRLNIIAWFRLVALIFREVCIRAGISFPLQKQLDSYIRINEALEEYLLELKKLDIDKFKEETEQYNNMLYMLENAEDANSLNMILKNEYKALGIELPYEGEFEDFMNDEDSFLVFK